MTSPLRPVLTVQALKDAYEALRRSEVVDGHPLFGFMLVRQKLHHPAALRGNAVERRAVLDVLIDIATIQLSHLRSLYDRPPADLYASLTTALAELEQDGLPNNDQLVGCSFIYHRYVRADLDLSVQEIYEYLRYDERQGRRRTNKYWEILLGEFIHRETHVRAQERANRCLLAIPRTQYAQLLSQQVIVDALLQLINDHTQPMQLLVYGVSGGGKTTIALQLSEALISTNRIVDVAWIDLRSQSRTLKLPSEERLASLICQQLQLPRHPAMTALQDLLSYLHILINEDQQLLVVLLHVDEWQISLQDAWQWLSHCMVIATSETPMGAWQGVEIDCPPLDEEDTVMLFDYFVKRHPLVKESPPDRLYDYLWDFTGGNPRSLRNYFRAWVTNPTEEPIYFLPTQDNIREIWQRLSTSNRQLWLLIDLMTIAQNRLSHQELMSETEDTLLSTRETVETDIAQLLQVGLIEQHSVDSRGKYYRIPEDIRDNIIQNALSEPLFSDHIDRLLSLTSEDKKLSFGFLQQIFALPFEISNLSRWLPSTHEYIRMSGQWDTWLTFIETLLQTGKLSTEDEAWFELEAITTLRWLGRFDEALHRLESLATPVNRVEDKRLLGAIGIEQSTILFYKNYINQSLEAAHEAHRLLSPIEDETSELLQRNQVAIIRALIETQPDEAQYWLDNIVVQGPTILNLVVELKLKQGNVNQALHAAKQVMSQLRDDDPNYSRAHNILAKVLIANKQYKKAIDEFAFAINRLQPKKDLVALARLYNNRSVALMYEGGLDEAEESLQLSLMLHKDLEDMHGWNISRENLQLIHDLQMKGFRSLRDSDFPYSSRLL